MTLPTSEPLPPENSQRLPPARRRRRSRMIAPGDTSERSRYLEALARQFVPSFDYFLLIILCGLILSIALLADSAVLFILAALTVPFMAPVIGLGLASVFGSRRYFLQSLGGIAVSGLIIFIECALAGALARLWPALSFNQALFHTHFSWPDFILLTVGAILTPILATRNEGQKRHIVTSVALAYEVFLPLGVAGFGLTSGVPLLWPDGLVVFIVHLAWAALIGTAAFAILGLRPRTVLGYTIGSTLLLISLAGVVAVSGISTAMSSRLAMPTFSPTPSITPLPSATATITPIPPTPTSTPTRTLIPTKTATITLTPEPTPVYARINSPSDMGAVIRSEPNTNSTIVKSLLNGWLVEIIQGKEVTTNGMVWVYIRTSEGDQGWIMRSLLAIK